MVKIVNWNINGFRSPSMNVLNKKEFNKESGLYKLIYDSNPDIICFSETKCQQKNEETFNKIMPFEYNVWNSSTKKLGYSGVAIFSKIPFTMLKIDELDEFANDDCKLMSGRYLLLEFDNFILFHAYVPNSGLGKDLHRQLWNNIIINFLNNNNLSKPIIYCGDLNVVCDVNDISNEKLLIQGMNPGTKKYERENFNEMKKLGFIDIHRHINPNDKLYTWGSKNSGMRLDYFLISEQLKESVGHSKIYNDVIGSDHCPIYLELEF